MKSVVLVCLLVCVCSLLIVEYGLVSSGVVFFFFQAEDGIRDLVRSRGLGDVYKRQGTTMNRLVSRRMVFVEIDAHENARHAGAAPYLNLSLIHI